MKRRSVFAILAVTILAFGVMVLPAGSQEKSTSSAEAKRAIPLKVTVVFEEFDGQNKIASLPYSFYVNANDTFHRRASIRSGLRVPISSSESSEKSAIQYMDVGANIDCNAASEGELFLLELGVQRSWLFTADETKGSSNSPRTISGANGDPIIQQFSSGYTLSMRDGQTIEASSAANPINGHVIKVVVTMNVVK